jgi:ketosteroid isomerase-like protein
MTSYARTAAERYLEAVNGADIDGLLALFDDAVVVRHPTGAYAGHAGAREFYEGVVFAG